MNRIIVSAGLMAVGVAGVQAANTADLSPSETSKPWSISASLRAFYDDNWNTANKNVSPGPQESFGIEVKPAASIYYLPNEQTYLGAAYVYSMKWFEGRKDHSIDQSHELTLKADHRFSERFRINLNDNLVYAQEPDIVEPTGAQALFARANQNVFRNRAALKLNSQITERTELESGYQNVYYDYKDPIYSATLDRDEHIIWLDGIYHLQEHFSALIGYQLHYFDYMNETKSADDNIGHSIYVGARKSITQQLNVEGKVGVQLTHYMHKISSASEPRDQDEFGPYVDASASYEYLPGSVFKVGVNVTRVPSDIIGATDQESEAIYAQLSHKVTANLTASLVGQFQHNTLHAPGFPELDNAKDNDLLLGLNFDYKINNNLSAEAGYNFDRLDADLPGRSYTRNRVYAGIRASY
jgi:hypothetical protein